MKEREEYKKKLGDVAKPLDRRLIAQWQKDTDQKLKEYHDKIGTKWNERTS